MLIESRAAFLLYMLIDDKTLDRFLKLKEEILRFNIGLRVPLEKNQVERDLRIVRVQHKISEAFRIPKGVDAFCRIKG
jgi:hypothetical protein